MAKPKYGTGVEASAGQFVSKSDQGLDSGLIGHPMMVLSSDFATIPGKGLPQPDSTKTVKFQELQ